MKGDGPDRAPLLVNTDQAMLEPGDPRHDLNCAVTPEKPVLGLDLKFHAGYTVAIPLGDVEGMGNRLTVVFRVTPKAGGNAAYFSDHIRVPPITQTSGTALFAGSFDVGAGDYHVDWLIRDLGERYCSFYWDVTAERSPHDWNVALAVPPNTIRATEQDQFQPEVRRGRAEDPSLKVKVLMNFAPEKPNSAAISARDRLALISILRDLSRNPHIGQVSLITFNLDEQRVLYRQDFSNQIDFPALGRALKNLNLGTVDYRQLRDPNRDVEFLSTLAKTEMTGDRSFDGLIFVGPKLRADSSVPENSLKQIGEPRYPVFYLNYTPDPLALPWSDVIGKMVKFFKGREFTISGPKDLFDAVGEVVARMTRSKMSRSAALFSGRAVEP